MTYRKATEPPILLVMRSTPPQSGYRWEIRRRTFGLPLQSCEGTYPSETDARLAGEKAMATIELPTSPPSDPTLNDVPKLKQRNLMRHLFKVHGGDEMLVCAAYAQAEKEGKVLRRSDDNSMPAEAYARALWHDGVVRRWLARED